MINMETLSMHKARHYHYAMWQWLAKEKTYKTYTGEDLLEIKYFWPGWEDFELNQKKDTSFCFACAYAQTTQKMYKHVKWIPFCRLCPITWTADMGQNMTTLCSAAEYGLWARCIRKGDIKYAIKMARQISGLHWTRRHPKMKPFRF